jgi:C4-dicarboxylate-specific signal transduction histidine kinase
MNKAFRPRWILLPVVVLVLGIMSFGTIFLTHKIHLDLHEFFFIEDVNNNVQQSMLQAHLLIEEIRDDDPLIRFENVRSKIDKSNSTMDAMLYGGTSMHGEVIKPLQDSELREIAKQIKAQIVQFRDYIEQMRKTGNNSTLDRQYDSVFNQFIDMSGKLDDTIETLQSRYESRLNNLFLITLLLWSAILLIAILGISFIELKRKSADEEVKKHRKYLMEMVEERTSELNTNRIRLEKEISERKRKEEELERMALFAELNPSPVMRFDKSGEVLMANPAAIEIFALESWSGMYTRMYLKSLIPGIQEFDLAGCILNGRIISHSAQLGNRHFHFTFRGLSEMGFGQIYGSDITEKMMIEAEIMRASQLASIGELAAGVAHEINNPINGIINFAQIIADKTNAGSKENKVAHHIINEGDRIAKIVASLLSFARSTENDRSSIRFKEVLSESLLMINAQLRKEGTRMKISIPSRLPEIRADFQEIEQVCLNIINNARHTLNVKYPHSHENKNLEIIGEEVKVDGSPYVRVIFHDHGVGIPKDLMGKIMNPFFTTKPPGSGTGLGLSISYNIIRSHGGNMKIQSVEGEGTKAIIELPAMTKMQIDKNAITGKA